MVANARSILDAFGEVQQQVADELLTNKQGMVANARGADDYEQGTVANAWGILYGKCRLEARYCYQYLIRSATINDVAVLVFPHYWGEQQ